MSSLSGFVVPYLTLEKPFRFFFGYIMLHLLKQKNTGCEESWEFQTVFQSVEHKLPSFLYSRNAKLSQVLAVAESYAQISYRQGSFQWFQIQSWFHQRDSW